jgi:membrane protease YdiL (CAAX protease family)
MKKNMFVVTFTIVFVVILYYVDAALRLNYLNKVFIKIGLIALSFFIGRAIGLDFSFLKPKKTKVYRKGFIVSIIAFSAVIIGFLVIRNYLDYQVMIDEFKNKYELTGIKFFIASIYLVVFNAFLEEYFFRGFVFFNLNNRKFAYVFSSLAFSIYHISNFKNWFTNDLLIIIPLVGLFLSGVLFNYLDSKSKDIYNSYIPHFTADLAIVIIGYFIIF